MLIRVTIRIKQFLREFLVFYHCWVTNEFCGISCLGEGYDIPVLFNEYVAMSLVGRYHFTFFAVVKYVTQKITSIEARYALNGAFETDNRKRQSREQHHHHQQQQQHF